MPDFNGKNNDFDTQDPSTHRVISTQMSIIQSLLEECHDNELRITLPHQNEALQLTELQRMIIPGAWLTKRNLLLYYTRISPWLLPHLYHRGLILKRYPEGLDGDFFFQSEIQKPPGFLKTFQWDSSDGKAQSALLCENLESLLYLINLGCIAFYPFSSRISTIENPDWLVWSLYPLNPIGHGNVSQSKFSQGVGLFYQELRKRNGTGFMKTRTFQSIDIVLPIISEEPGGQWTKVNLAAIAFSKMMIRQYPDRFISQERVSVLQSPLEDKIVINTELNRFGTGLMAPYSLEESRHGSVSIPISCLEELEMIPVPHWKNIESHLAKHGDLWEDLSKNPIPLRQFINDLDSASGVD